MCYDKYWLYSSLDELIDFDVDSKDIEEESPNDRTDITQTGNDSSKPKP